MSDVDVVERAAVIEAVHKALLAVHVSEVFEHKSVRKAALFDANDVAMDAIRSLPSAPPAAWSSVEECAEAIQRQVIDHLPNPLPGGMSIAQAAARVALQRQGQRERSRP